MRTVTICLGLALMLFGAKAQAGTTLDFWHSYVPAEKRETHYGFHLTCYKRGLFFGSCGPSTKSLQWAFTFDLAGQGPVYPARQVSVSDDNSQPLRVVSGQVVIDEKRHTATIDLEVESAGRTNKFIGNGTYRIHRLK